MATPLLPLVERILEGQLRETLQEHRTAGLTYEAISRRFLADHDIDVTGETVRNWCNKLEIKDPKTKASA